MKMDNIPKIIGRTENSFSEKNNTTSTIAEIAAEVSAIFIAVCLGDILFIVKKFGKNCPKAGLPLNSFFVFVICPCSTAAERS